jgi:phage terminase small subunit
MSDQVVELKPKNGRPRKTEFTRLTKKQNDFVDLVCTKEGQLTLREIAAAAGYANSGSHTRAYELLNPRLNPHVVAAVKRKREELNEKYAVDYGRHIRDLQRLRDDAVASNAWTAAIMAERLRGQAAGLYVSKSEIRVGSIDSMSKAEVERALADLKKTMGGKIIEGEVIDAGSETVAGSSDGSESDPAGDSTDSD